MNYLKFRDPLNGEIRLTHHDQNGKWVDCPSILDGQCGDYTPTGAKIESSLRTFSNTWNTVSPMHSRLNRVSKSQDAPNVQRVKDAGESEGSLVMSEIMPYGFTERWQTSSWFQPINQR